jgi:hypothetical protein
MVLRATTPVLHTDRCCSTHFQLRIVLRTVTCCFFLHCPLLFYILSATYRPTRYHLLLFTLSAAFLYIVSCCFSDWKLLVLSANCVLYTWQLVFLVLKAVRSIHCQLLFFVLKDLCSKPCQLLSFIMKALFDVQPAAVLRTESCVSYTGCCCCSYWSCVLYTASCCSLY